MKLTASAFELFDKEWALLAAGNSEGFNAMTISWGGLGTLWGKPVVTVYVKPIRYTHRFLEANDCFTVSFYSEKFRRALALLGTLSGRDTDKIARAGLTPEFLKEGVTFSEAHTTLVAKKIYRQTLNPDTMPKDVVADYYRDEPPHTMFVGEVIEILKK